MNPTTRPTTHYALAQRSEAKRVILKELRAQFFRALHMNIKFALGTTRARAANISKCTSAQRILQIPGKIAIEALAYDAPAAVKERIQKWNKWPPKLFAYLSWHPEQVIPILRFFEKHAINSPAAKWFSFCLISVLLDKQTMKPKELFRRLSATTPEKRLLAVRKDFQGINGDLVCAYFSTNVLLFVDFFQLSKSKQTQYVDFVIRNHEAILAAREYAVLSERFIALLSQVQDEDLSRFFCDTEAMIVAKAGNCKVNQELRSTNLVLNRCRERFIVSHLPPRAVLDEFFNATIWVPSLGRYFNPADIIDMLAGDNYSPFGSFQYNNWPIHNRDRLNRIRNFQGLPPTYLHGTPLMFVEDIIAKGGLYPALLLREGEQKYAAGLENYWGNYHCRYGVEPEGKRGLFLELGTSTDFSSRTPRSKNIGRFAWWSKNGVVFELSLPAETVASRQLRGNFLSPKTPDFEPVFHSSAVPGYDLYLTAPVLFTNRQILRIYASNKQVEAMLLFMFRKYYGLASEAQLYSRFGLELHLMEEQAEVLRKINQELNECISAWLDSHEAAVNYFCQQSFVLEAFLCQELKQRGIAVANPLINGLARELAAVSPNNYRWLDRSSSSSNSGSSTRIITPEINAEEIGVKLPPEAHKIIDRMDVLGRKPDAREGAAKIIKNFKKEILDLGLAEDVATHLFSRLRDCSNQLGNPFLLKGGNSLQAFVDGAVWRNREKAQENKVTINISALPPELAAVRCDMDLFRILKNLISNAVKYCDFQKSAADRIVDLKIQRDDARLIITIADTGRGMSGDEIWHYGEKGWRSLNAKKSGIKGHGNGAESAIRRIGRHGGILEISSRPQIGTTIMVFLSLVNIVDLS